MKGTFFALKSLSKRGVMEGGQVQHIKDEKTVSDISMEYILFASPTSDILLYACFGCCTKFELDTFIGRKAMAEHWKFLDDGGCSFADIYY